MDQVTIWIDAPPESVWGLVTDITRYGEWSPENRGGRWRDDPGPGARFKGRNRHGVMRWTTSCRVVAYERPDRFVFEVKDSRMRWGYLLKAEGVGTRLTETREHIGTPPFPVRMLIATGALGADREKLMVDGMRQTLARIKRVAEHEVLRA